MLALCKLPFVSEVCSVEFRNTTLLLVLFLLPWRCPVDFNFFSSECNVNFANSSGVILSPHYPGYYPPVTRCHWTINVPPGNIIKLRFLEFQLEDHPSCYNDFIEVYSGLANARRKIGRYCGQRFPAFLLSSSNIMEIMFVSNEKVTRSGMKLYYTSEKSRWLHTSRRVHAAY